MTESISIALLISIISLVCTVINTFTGSKKAMKEQDEKDKSRQLDIEKNFVKIVSSDDFVLIIFPNNLSTTSFAL